MRKGETILVKPTGLGLGMTPGERFTRSLRIDELELEPEDAIVLYSDGVTEAVNHKMEQFGEAAPDARGGAYRRPVRAGRKP